MARDEVVLATKAGITAGRSGRRYDTSRGHLLATLDASLRRLGTDHVDLWQVHVWSEDAPLEETLSALDLAVSSGRASYVGVSNYAGWQTAQAATWQRAVPGRAALASTQVEYSLLNRSVEAEVLPAAAAPRASACCPGRRWAAACSPASTAPARPSDSRAASSDFASFVNPYLAERPGRIVEAVARAADGLGWTPIEVALAWVRDRPGVTAPIVGARTAAQLEAALDRGGADPAGRDRRRPRRRLGEPDRDGPRGPAPALAAGWSGSSSGAFSREFSRNVVTKLLVERAEHGGWELARVRITPDGTRRVVLSRKIIRRGRPLGILAAGLSASDLVEEPVEDPGAELQRVRRHPLVHAVEQRGEVEVRRQPQRGEAVGAHAEPVEVLGVGAAAHQVRRHHRVRVLGQQRAGHRVHEVPVVRRLPGGC